MSRSTGPVRTLLLVLIAGGTGLLLGLGAVSVASALGSTPVQELGNPVVFDPTTITPSAAATPVPADEPGGGAAVPTPTPAPTSPAAPTAPSGTSAEPHQVAPAAPAAITDDDHDLDDEDVDVDVDHDDPDDD